MTAVVLIGHATSNGHGCADYEQPLPEGEIGGRYALKMARERLEGLGKAAAKINSPTFTPKNQDPTRKC